MKCILRAFVFLGALAWFFTNVTFADPLHQDEGARSPLVKINVDLVQLEVFVTDSKGNYVTDLESSSFSVKENGTEYPIEYFQFVPVGPSDGKKQIIQDSFQSSSPTQLEGKERRTIPVSS